MNPGTIAYVTVDSDNQFKYLFISFGVSVRGFCYMRKVICLDGTFLKSKYRGTLLLAAAQDGNFQIYLLAWGIVDSENNASWTWFLERLRDQIPDTDELVFVLDRHRSIKSAIAKTFVQTHHGTCTWHLRQNILTKFKSAGLRKLFDDIAKAYRIPDFREKFAKICHKNANTEKSLEDAGFEQWSRAHFVCNQYNTVTSNNAESLNYAIKYAREWPVVALLDEIRKMQTTWFYERCTSAKECKTPLTPTVEKVIATKFDKSSRINVNPLNQFEFEVKGGALDALVNLEKLSCTCREFNVDEIPCEHAIPATMHR